MLAHALPPFSIFSKEENALCFKKFGRNTEIGGSFICS